MNHYSFKDKSESDSTLLSSFVVQPNKILWIQHMNTSYKHLSWICVWWFKEFRLWLFVIPAYLHYSYYSITQVHLFQNRQYIYFFTVGGSTTRSPTHILYVHTYIHRRWESAVSTSACLNLSSNRARSGWLTCSWPWHSSELCRAPKFTGWGWGWERVSWSWEWGTEQHLNIVKTTYVYSDLSMK